MARSCDSGELSDVLPIRVLTVPRFTVEEIESSEGSLNASAVIMPAIAAQAEALIVTDDYDADSVISLHSSVGSFVDLEDVITNGSIATGETPNLDEHDDFDFVEEDSEAEVTGDEL